MSDFNYERILSSSPAKRLLIGYNNLKENYNESAAKEYKALYENQPLSFILEYADYIFPESYFGLEFFENVILNKSIAYPKLEDQIDKVESYLYVNESRMPSIQRERYTSLLEKMKTLRSENINKCMISGYGYEIAESATRENIEKLWDDVYSEKSKEEIIDDLKVIKDPTSYFPYICDIMEHYKSSAPVSHTIHDYITETAITDVSNRDDSLVNMSYSIFLLNKLSHDKNYTESVNNIPIATLKILLNGFINESVVDHLEEMRKVSIDEEYFPESAEFAVNHLFDDFYSVESNEENKEYFNSIENSVYNPVAQLMMYEYAHLDDTSVDLIGYESVINESISYDDMMEVFAEEKKETYEDIAGSMPKSVTTSIQTKAMDKEVEHYKKKAERSRKNQSIKNAAKAVAAIPEDTVKSMQNVVSEWDKADDDRRKKYILKPGFRKKIFHNLKLALMYGAVGTCNLLLVPALAVIRHFSKIKDRRIRNELIREVETEIKITDEKISDANSNNDTDKKYKLMRIKSKLEEELARIKSNSKYI